MKRHLKYALPSGSMLIFLQFIITKMMEINMPFFYQIIICALILVVINIIIFYLLRDKKDDKNPDIDEWKKIISEIFYCLEHYARWYGNIGSGHLNDMKRAYNALQQSAHRMIASANTLNYPIDQSRVEEAKALLLGISNTLIDENILTMQQNRGYVSDPEESEARMRQSRENRENAERIKRLLQCAKST